MPRLATLHGRLDGSGVAQMQRYCPEFPLVSISNSQRAPLREAHWLATVHHGLPLARYPMGKGDGGYFVFLGRMSPEKGPEVAIRLARRAGVRLVMAAKINRAERDYYDQVLAPLISASPGSITSARSMTRARWPCCHGRAGCCFRSPGRSRSAW